MDLNLQFPAKELPPKPYVGLFGNHHNNWRQWATAVLAQRGVRESQIYDSTDKGWCVVNELSGDPLQPWIDELVKRQHHAMKNAACLIFSMDSKRRTWPMVDLSSAGSIPRETEPYVGSIFAARCELGWLAGISKPSFVWIPDDLEGRNYLRAVLNLYDWLVPVASIHEACLRTVEFFDRNT